MVLCLITYGALRAYDISCACNCPGEGEHDHLGGTNHVEQRQMCSSFLQPNWSAGQAIRSVTPESTPADQPWVAGSSQEKLVKKFRGIRGRAPVVSSNEPFTCTGRQGETRVTRNMRLLPEGSMMSPFDVRKMHASRNHLPRTKYGPQCAPWRLSPEVVSPPLTSVVSLFWIEHHDGPEMKNNTAFAWPTPSNIRPCARTVGNVHYSPWSLNNMFDSAVGQCRFRHFTEAQAGDCIGFRTPHPVIDGIINPE